MVRAGLLLLACGLAACGGNQTPASHTGRSITLTDTILTTGGSDTVRFGHMRSGETAQLQLWLVNDASHAVAVTAYERTCGCTTLEFDPQPIAPGAERQITLTFDSRGISGWQFKAVDITLAGAAYPLRLWVEAEVE